MVHYFLRHRGDAVGLGSVTLTEDKRRLGVACRQKVDDRS
jgi:hypothetical protein